MKRKVNITEVVLRDANQSQIATRMPRSDFADILETMDEAGYYSMEVWGGATFDSCLRYLDEDPWDRLRFIEGQEDQAADAAERSEYPWLQALLR